MIYCTKQLTGISESITYLFIFALVKNRLQITGNIDTMLTIRQGKLQVKQILTGEDIYLKMDYFKLNREIAYLGLVGHLREEFCVGFIKKKQEFFEKLHSQQGETAAARNETITCSRGCTHCCHLFVGASIQEAEAIVYYLYKNEDKLEWFLYTYPGWRERVKESGDLFRKQPQENKRPDVNSNNPNRNKKVGDLASYARLHIPCPFLQDNNCSIYEVRPFVCAGLTVTSPPEWCAPKHPRHSERKIYKIPDAMLADRTFYWKNLDRPVWSFMPIMVYDILEYGLKGIPGISKMGDLLSRYAFDPDVQAVIKRYRNSPV
jgi:Fe-S-cluster containining protein